ncbi:hypothetical protein Pan44_08970 [Caulifigura coniformis]|uniref:DUF5615 domain-containing protein n=1 Tax=Caulifigura coniformis TaxID=2527983 RepID=A0A517S9T0_9PLAN|nr:DUF5615 family PIN-like protein [Caulifigura coniformis]QDT52884.1 hypothetical protein Pan44_08970 [Caulifigura coniformis]
MTSEPEIRYLLDEHIPHVVLAGLRRRNIDFTSINEMRLKGIEDTNVLALARELGRIVVTQDSDFLVEPLSVESHAGIVFVRAGMSISSVLDVLQLIHRACTPVEMHNHIEHASSLQ